jgi:hypothetical protein
MIFQAQIWSQGTSEGVLLQDSIDIRFALQKAENKKSALGKPHCPYLLPITHKSRNSISSANPQRHIFRNIIPTLFSFAETGILLP